MFNVNESCHLKKNLTNIPSDTARALYFYVQWTGHFVCKTDFHIHRSNMNSFELLFTVSGKGTLVYDGEAYTLSPGSVMFIDCTKPHEYYPLVDKWEFMYVHFNGCLSSSCYEHFSSLQKSPITTAPETAEWFESVVKLVEASGAEELHSDMIYRIMMKLISTAGTRGGDDYPTSLIKETLSYIAKNFTESISVDDLAGLSHMSRSHFTVFFKENTGISPHLYINKYRVNVAKRALYTTNKTISEIALECGFQDSSSFIRVFKRLEGISPLAYRKSVTK